ncbi:MAG: hypothetical protein IT292_03940 [Deltaproteobacteria bacterium]|nr:hypothetical protein [Deltaproteobacteria bacterium]
MLDSCLLQDANIYKRSLSTRTLAFSLLIIGVAASYLLLPIVDGASFYFIAQGLSTLNNNTFISILAAGSPLTSSSYIFELIVGYIYAQASVGMLLLFKFFVLYLSWFWLTHILSRISGDIFIGTLISLFLGLALYFQNSLSPQLIIYPLSLAIICELSVYAQQQNLKNLGKLFVLFCLGANLSMSYLFIVVLGLLYVLLACRQGSLKFTLLTILLAMISPLCSVSLLDNYLNFNALLRAGLGEIVFALHPSTIYYYQAPLLLLTMGVACYCLLNLTRPQPRLGYVLIACAVIGLLSENFLPLALLLTAALVARLWREDRLPLPLIRQNIAKLKSRLGVFPLQGGVFFLFALSIFLYSKKSLHPLTELLFPQKEVSAILADKKLQPVMHSLELGDYFYYRLAGFESGSEAAIFADRRLLTSDYASYLKLQALDSLGQGVKAQEMIEKYKIKSVLCLINSPLYQWLSVQKDWHLWSELSADRAQRYVLFDKLQ